MRICKHGLFAFLLLIKFNLAFCQNKNNVEFSAFEIYNKQADYTSHYGDVSFTNNLKLYGNNIGFKIDYKRLISKKTYLKLGLGYLNFGINRIKNVTNNGNFITTNKTRLISYPSNVFIQYITTKYNYNNLVYHIGLEKQYNLSQKQDIVIGIDYFHANTFSESYYITAIPVYYKTNHQGPFGDFFNLNIGLNKKFGNLSFIPSLVVPVYKSWRQDFVFKENPNKYINNWFGGIGINLSVSYQ